MNCKTLTVAMMIVISSPALAVTANAITELEGTWSTKGGCLDRSTGFNPQIYLKPNSIEGWEWGCQFLSKLPNAHGQTVIIASCSAEGESWPDMLLLEYYAPNGWMLTSKGDNGVNNTINFVEQCEKN